MACYIFHDSFIRPTLSQSVLKTRNENVFRASKNVKIIPTKIEKRKREVVQKENVDINQGKFKNIQLNIQHEKEELIKQVLEEHSSFTVPERYFEHGSISICDDNYEKFESEELPILSFPLEETLVPPPSSKCHQTVTKDPEKFKAKIHEEEQIFLSQLINKIRILQFPVEKTVIYPQMDSCSILEVQNVAQEKAEEAINHEILNHIEIKDNTEFLLVDDLPVQETQFFKIDPKKIDEEKHGIENIGVPETHLCPKPRDLEKVNNKNAIQLKISKADLVERNIFIHNDLKNENIVHDDSESDDELPNLEYVDKNSVMQQDLLKRNDSDSQKFYRAVKNEDNLIIRGCEANKIKKIEKFGHKPTKTRSRYVSPRNIKDRTIEKEYNKYQKVLANEKMKKKENNLKEAPTKSSKNIKYQETNINISLSCDSAAAASSSKISLILTSLSLLMSSLFVLSFLQILVELELNIR